MAPGGSPKRGNVDPALNPNEIEVESDQDGPDQALNAPPSAIELSAIAYTS